MPSGRGFEGAGFDLGEESGDAHHKKFVKIRSYNRQELDTFKEGIGFVLRLLKHAMLEGEETQFRRSCRAEGF